jgi:hypothetical protein
MPEQVTTLEVYRPVMERKITLVPGKFFHHSGSSKIVFALTSEALSPRADAAVTTLGGIVAALS